MNIESEWLNRTERLVGSDIMHNITAQRVIILGVGGVGSWCAESLIRSGIKQLTIVDADCVCASNINRQLMATTRTVGQAKVEALKERLLDINPKANITAIQKIFNADTAESFNLDQYDYIVDAIDSLKDKALLMLKACETKAKFFSSMGAALKMDPTQIRVAEFWKVRGCPLGSALRKKFKHMKVRPTHKFSCVYSEEVLENRGEAMSSPGDVMYNKVQVNGSMVHITAIFGFTIGGLVLNDIYQKTLGAVSASTQASSTENE